jgi:hypothetical protein
MGNTIATNPQIKESIKDAYTSDKQLFDKILEKSREIYSKNKLQIGDKELYERLAITYSNQLYKLPLEKIETIYSQMEEQSAVKNEMKPFLELSLKYDGLEEEKFIVNQLSGKLVENFKNKKIPAEVERNGIQLKLPDLYYIHNKVLLLLDGIQQRENNKLEKQIGGIYFHNLSLSNNGIIDPEDRKYVNINKLNNKNNKNKSGGSLMNNNNSNDPYNGNSNGNSISESNNGNYFNQNKGKKKLNINPPYPQKKQKKSLNSIENELKSLENENNPNKKNNPNPNSNGKKNLNNNGKKNKINIPPISLPPPAPKSKPIIIPEEDSLCTDPTVPCKLTKMEMCVKIVMNLMTRNNIILAILSTIPIQTKNGDYEGSFTFERLTSLKKGQFCAPSPLSDFQDDEDDVRIHKIMRFLNMMDDETCKKSGGRIFQLTEKQMKDMLEDETFGKKYYEYGNKINLIYQESIRALLTMLEKLESNFTISTNELNEISAAVKNTIDELYIKTQLNFLLAVLVVMDFDFSKNPVKLMKVEKRMNEIKKGIFQKSPKDPHQTVL